MTANTSLKNETHIGWHCNEYLCLIGNYLNKKFGGGHFEIKNGGPTF